MQQSVMEVSRKERVMFDLICNIDELQSLKSNLSLLEINQIAQLFDAFDALAVQGDHHG